MSMRTATVAELEAENAGLKRKLDEAEETLRAIRHNEVDALVVVRPEGETVLTLAGSDYPYRLVLESLNEGAVTLLADGTIFYCNAHFAGSVGLPTGQLTGTPFEQWLASADREAFRAALQAAEPGLRRGEFTLQGAAGRAVPVQISLHPLQTELIDAVSVVVTDISSRLHAERAVQESETRYRALVEQAADGIFIADEQGRYLDVNTTACRMLGYTRAEILGRDYTLILQPADAAADPPRFDLLLDGKPFLRERFYRRKDGTLFPVEISAKMLSDGRIQSIVRDITERKQAEQALQASETRFRSLVEHGSDAIILIDASSAITFTGPSTERVLGYPEAEFVGRTIFTLIHPNDLAVTSAMFAELLAAPGKSLSGECRVRHRDGSWRWVEVSGTNLLREPSVGAVVINLRDVSERRSAQKQIHFQASILAQVRNAVIATDTEGRITYWNSYAETLYQWTAVEALGKQASALLVAEQDASEVAEILASLNETGFWEGEFYVRRKDGFLFPVHVVDTLIRDASGRRRGIVGVSTDMSERIAMQESLRRRLAELEIVRSVSVALRTARSLDEAMPILLDETLAALETTAGVIWLYHPANDELRAAVSRSWLSQFNHDRLKPGVGIVGMVFAGGQSHVSADFAADPQRQQTAGEQVPAGWSSACVPLRTSAITVGTLFVAVPPPHVITTERLQLLESLAELGGAAIHRMSLSDETARQLARLEALHDIDRAISSSMDLRVTLDVVLQHVKVELAVDAADVLVLNPSLNTLDFAAGSGFLTSRAKTAHIRLGEGFAGRAALERHPVQISDSALAHGNAQFGLLWDAEHLAGYYAMPLVAKGRVKGVLEAYRRTPLVPGPGWTSFLETLAGQAAIAIESAQLFENLQRSNTDLAFAYDATIEGWSRALDLRDKETEGHTQRVTEITVRLARAVGVSEEELVHIRRGTLLHDIGKMGVPDSILLKPGSLTAEEWVVMCRHPTYAYQLLSPISFLRPALDIPYCHHEKWDGTGYPRGMQGEQIPLSARVFAAVDVWDALCSDRPYRKAWLEADVRAHMQSLSGTHFDPKVVADFLRSV